MKMDELLDRYNKKSRQTIYNWAEAAEIVLETPDGRNIDAPMEQVEILDSVQEHLRKGNSLESFVPPSKVSVVQPEIDNELDTKSSTDIRSVQSRMDTIDLVHFLSQLALRSEQSSGAKRSQDYLNPERQLQELADNGWLIESSRLEQILGVKPRSGRGTNYFTRRGWKFTKAGKNGREVAWRVERF